ncbi:hypothetical protein INT45_009606 [Circinella minor]|uniref:Uncharacterized protein n=1 Tax=Circinella minor TaxID=1195481 RepID=A0A8H7S743_9FUNG|nr:hypothetical protein INT45_009606 [Circinella minor]
MTRRSQRTHSRNRNTPAMINMQNSNIIMAGSEGDLVDHLRRGRNNHHHNNNNNNNTPVRRSPLIRGFGGRGHRGCVPSHDGCPARDGGDILDIHNNNNL